MEPKQKLFDNHAVSESIRKKVESIISDHPLAGILKVEALIRRNLPLIAIDVSTIRYVESDNLNKFHYTFEDKNDKKYHLKTAALDAGANGDSRINEVFIYHLLDLVGYGPKVHTFLSEDMPGLIGIVTEHLSHQNKRFFEANKLMNAIFSTDYSYLIHAATIDLLISLLELDDVSRNEGNSGIRVNASKKVLEGYTGKLEEAIILDPNFMEPSQNTPRVAKLKVKVKPFIIDFQVSSIFKASALSTCTTYEARASDFNRCRRTKLPCLMTSESEWPYYLGF